MGHPVSEETRYKIHLGVSGDKNVHLGTHLSEETKEKQRTSNKKKICVYCEETGTIYRSMMEVTRQTGIDQSCITRCCKKELKTAGGLHWRYASEEERIILGEEAFKTIAK